MSAAGLLGPNLVFVGCVECSFSGTGSARSPGPVATCIAPMSKSFVLQKYRYKEGGDQKDRPRYDAVTRHRRIKFAHRRMHSYVYHIEWVYAGVSVSDFK